MSGGLASAPLLSPNILLILVRSAMLVVEQRQQLDVASSASGSVLDPGLESVMPVVVGQRRFKNPNVKRPVLFLTT